MHFTPIEYHSTYNEPSYPFEMIRHGETFYNVQGLGQGSTDDELAQLTEKGKNQAQKAGEFIASSIEQNQFSTYTKIISSDLGRALETAKIIQNIFLDKLQVLIPLETEVRLRAQNWGVYEKTPVNETYSELENMPAGNYSGKYPEWVPEGGESRNDVQKRVLEAIKDRLEAYENGERILYVVHNENIRVLMPNYQSTPNCGWVGFKIHPSNSENPVTHIWTNPTQ